MRQLALAAFLSVTAVGAYAQSATASDTERYELASLVKGMMVSRDKTGFRADYLSFKPLFASLRELSPANRRAAGTESFPGKEADYFYIYEARIPLFVRKRRLTAENMKDEYLWSVFIAGPRAAPSNVFIKSQWPVGQAAGASYFSSQGLDLAAMACERLGGSSHHITHNFS